MMAGRIRRAAVDDVAVLELDDPDRNVNVVDAELLEDLERHVDHVLADERYRGFVLVSAKSSGFGVGADIGWLPELAGRDDAEDLLADVHALMMRIADGGKPMVSVLHGTALGGALELALAGHGLVAVAGARIGLPEVTLELLPGGGATQFLTRWMPLEPALRLLTSGRPVRVEEAASTTDIVMETSVEHARRRAVTLASTLDPASRPVRPTFPSDALDTIATVRRELEASRHGISPAVTAVLDVVHHGVSGGMDAGLDAERRAFLERLRSPNARAALHLFMAESALKRQSSRGEQAPVARLAVIGAGQMGAGIAATAASRGVDVVVHDLDDDSLDRARAYRDRVDGGAGSGRARGSWEATTSWDGVGDADVAVEAVFELPDVKAEVLAEVSHRIGQDALVATNTSAISIASLARSVLKPERFLGMHFFSPVERMPLVELVPHARTALSAQERAAQVGRRLGKVPVVVGDAPGFFTSRVYARWLIEGVRLLMEGVPVDRIDAGARRVGFPVGPMLAHDLATLDLVVQASITQVAERLMTHRLDVEGVREALETLIRGGIRGRRHGHGFWAYVDGRRERPAPEVSDLLQVRRQEMTEDEVGERLLLAFATESYLAWEEGILCHPDDGDVAAVLGIGFPRALGGPFRWADELEAAHVVERCDRLGSAFPVGDEFRRLAAEGRLLADVLRRPTPFAEPAGAG